MTYQQQRVNDLITRVERFQKTLPPSSRSDDRFATRYQRYLGSSRTWTHRLKPRNWADLKRLDKWEAKLNSFIAEIETGSTLENFFEALPIVKYVASVYEMLQGQNNDRRCVFLIGRTGVGKSVTLQRLAAQHPADVAYLRLWKGMNESLPMIARAFARRLGAKEDLSGGRTFDNVITLLKGQPMTLIVEDVHEGGVLMLKLCKTLIDDTKVKLILSSYPTAYHRLLNGGTDAMAEAQQLLGRTIKPVETAWITGVTLADVTAYLQAATALNGDAPACARAILTAVQRGGNLRGLADAVDLAVANADEAGADLTSEMVQDAVALICTPKKENEVRT